MIAALALVAGCGAQPAATPIASAIVDSLYRVRQPFQTNGAPTPADLARMSPWLSGELRTLLTRADSLRSADIARAPDEKPAFAEGDLFSSLFEGPASYAIKAEEVQTTAEGSTVPVHFRHSDGTNTVEWIDTVVVRAEAGRLVVSDVRYGGTWDFANKGSLLNSLNFSFVAGSRDTREPVSPR